MEINYQFVTDLNNAEEEQLAALYLESGWWDGQGDTQWLRKMALHSALFLTARHDGQIVGMARVIADRVSDGYVQDVYVAVKCRGQGIGRELVRLVTEAAQEMGLSWILLIAAPGKTKLYEALGYREMDDHVPMKLGGLT